MKVTRQRVLATVGFMVSGLLVLAASCSFEKRTVSESKEQQVAEVIAIEVVAEKTFTANEFCAACHYAFGEEKLALRHEKAGIGCERCHGESERHRNDEDNVTPPEIMYPKDKIIPTCMMCHPRHTIEHVGPHKQLLASAKTIFDHVKAAIKVSAGLVHLIDEDHAGNVVLVSLTPNRFSLRLNTSIGIKQRNRTIQYTK